MPLARPLAATVHGPLASLLVAAAASGLLDRLARRFASFVFLLTHDTTGVSERARLIPWLLGAWLLAHVVGAPLIHGLSRLTGSSIELRRTAGAALGSSFVQTLFFALHWFVIAWGRRSLDWSVFAVSLFAVALVLAWAHEITFTNALVLGLGQAAVALTLLFLLAFAGTELGWWSF